MRRLILLTLIAAIMLSLPKTITAQTADRPTPTRAPTINPTPIVIGATPTNRLCRKKYQALSNCHTTTLCGMI